MKWLFAFAIAGLLLGAAFAIGIRALGCAEMRPAGCSYATGRMG